MVQLVLWYTHPCIHNKNGSAQISKSVLTLVGVRTYPHHCSSCEPDCSVKLWEKNPRPNWKPRWLNLSLVYPQTEFSSVWREPRDWNLSAIGESRPCPNTKRYNPITHSWTPKPTIDFFIIGIINNMFTNVESWTVRRDTCQPFETVCCSVCIRTRPRSSLKWPSGQPRSSLEWPSGQPRLWRSCWSRSQWWYCDLEGSDLSASSAIATEESRPLCTRSCTWDWPGPVAVLDQNLLHGGCVGWIRF